MSSKYKNVRTKEDDVTLDSKLEAERYRILKERQEKGEIDNLRVHPRYDLVVNGKKICTYVADFAYSCIETTKDVRSLPQMMLIDGIEQEVWVKKEVDIGIRVDRVEDVKGRQSGIPYNIFKLKKALFEATQAIKIHEITKKEINS